MKAVARTGQEGHEPVPKIVGGVSILAGAVIATPRKAGEMNAEFESRVENCVDPGRHDRILAHRPTHKGKGKLANGQTGFAKVIS